MKPTHLLTRSLLTITVITLATNTNATMSSYDNDIGFIRNEGQVRDEKGAPAKDVLYMAYADGIQVQLRRTGFSYQVYCSPDVTGRSKRTFHEFDPDATVSVERIDFDLALSQSGVPFVVQEGEELPGELNFAGEKEISGVKHFRSVTFVGAWAGADLLFEIVPGSSGKPRFKYSIIAHEGTPIASLGMSTRGLANSRVEGATLHMEGPHFGIEEHIPESWLIDARGEKTPVEMAYTSSEESPSKTFFTCTDRALTTVPIGQRLVIDPTPNLQWGVYFGGSGSEDLSNLAVKKTASGAIAVSGATTSTSGVATVGAAWTTHAGGLYDAFVASFSSSGTLNWATYFGGASLDYGSACAFDPSGSVYLCGYTTSTGLGHHGFQNVIGGGEDGFLARFTSTGAFQWSTYYGGALNDRLFDVCTDASGSVYVAGDALSSGLNSPGAHQTTQNGGKDIILAKFFGNGGRQWCTYYGGAADDLAPSVVTNASNSVYLAGVTSSLNGGNIIATAGTHQTALSTAPDGLLVKFTSNGARQWGTYYGGNGYERINDVALDCNNAIYVVGCTGSTNGTSIASPGAFRTTLSGGVWDGFFAKLTSSGTRMYGSYYGGNGGDCLTSVSVADPDVVYYGGWTESTSGIAVGSNLWQSIHGGGVGDGYVGRFTQAGVVVYSTYYGGVGYDSVEGIECFTQGNVVFAGGTSSASGIATMGSLSGPRDLFLAEFNGPQTSDCPGTPAMPLAPPPPMAELCERMNDGVIHDATAGTLRIAPVLCTACGVNIFDLSGRRVIATQMISDQLTLPDELRMKPFIVQIVTERGTCSRVMAP